MTSGDRSHGLPTLSRVWQHVKLLEVSLEIRPQDSLVAGEDINKPTKQRNTGQEEQWKDLTDIEGESNWTGKNRNWKVRMVN